MPIGAKREKVEECPLYIRSSVKAQISRHFTTYLMDKSRLSRSTIVDQVGNALPIYLGDNQPPPRRSSVCLMTKQDEYL